MNNRVLYISNQRVDLPDSVSFNLKWQCAEPGELKIYGSGSTTIRLPFTPANDAVFRYSKFLTVIGGREFETFTDCRYYERGRLMISGGTAFLVAISEGYEICLTWGNGDYVQSLKDKSVADLGGDTFQWDNTVQYPYAETSKSPNEYPTLYKKNGQLRFRYALSRPVFPYKNILGTVGISAANCPAAIWNFVTASLLQANSLQAKGKLTITFRGQGMDFPDWEFSLCNSVLLQTIEIDQAGEYSLQILNAMQVSTYYYYYDDGIEKQSPFIYSGDKSICIYLTKENPTGFAVGRSGGYQKAFVQNYTENTYAPMYRATGSSSQGSAGSVTTTQIQKPLLIAHSGGNDQYVEAYNPENPDTKTAYLAKGTYYLVAIMGASVSNRNDELPPDVPQASVFKASTHGGDAVLVNKDSSASTKIETPYGDWKLYPPKVVQMLGYSTAHDIVQDFMRLFTLMVILRDGKPQFFDLTKVLNNKANAYDFSPYFVSLDKIEFGNSKVGLRNEAKLADYEDFTGKRANGVFNTVGGKGNGGEYTQLAQITSYDTLTTFDGTTIPYFPAAEISYDDKTASYNGKLQDRPNLLVRGSTSYGIRDEDGVLYYLLKMNSKEDTLQFIIDNYWQDFVNIVGTQKTVTVKLNIDPGALFDFDFRRPVYMKQLSVYVFAQKINYKGAGVAELQGIVLPSTSTGTPKPIDDDGMLVDATDTYIVDSKDKYIVEN